MASFNNSFTRVATVLLIGLALISCSGGDNGSDGAAGAAGPVGPAGPPGPSTGSGIPIDSADKINIAVSSVDVPAAGGMPTVYFALTNDLDQGLKDLPAGDIRFVLSQLSAGTGGGSSEWHSYVTRSSNGIANAQANTETATSGTFVDYGDGTYEYTFEQALTDYPGGPTFNSIKTHRLGIEIRGQAPISSNGIHDFVPAGGAPLLERKIVDNNTCNACHDRLEFHGGPRTDVEYCVTCHNPNSTDEDSGNTVDMKALIHNIHAGRDGYAIIGYRGSLHDYSDIQWTQDIRNCQTCHEESDLNTPQASNWQLVPNRAACGTCHYDDGDTLNGVHDYAIEDGVHPLGLTLTDDTQCLLCHGPDATIVNGDVQVAKAHEIPEAIAAQAFEYEVVSVADTGPGDFPTVSIRVLDPTDPNYATDPASTAWDINDVNGPFQTGSARIKVDIAWSTNDYGNVDPSDDLARPALTGAPFAPIGVDFKSGAANNGSNVFTKTSTSAIPTGITGSGVAIVEGRPQLDLGNGPESLAVVGRGKSFAITDAAPVDRRQVVNIEKCNDCHNTLALHGDNRVGNTELCSTCHNPNATDINRRVAGGSCEVALGADDESIDLKRMIHGIHSGNVGLCGYGNRPHDYTALVYPGHLNNCEGCHLAGTYYPVDPDAVMATTVDVGADRSSLLDDLVISPNAAVCSSCHTSNLAKNHMIQNGGDFDAGKDNTGTLISSGVETCTLCHGPGRSADVGEVHAVGDFEFN